MENNPFQLTFTLRQHTPIIHFQHEQAGATLRATELKPKLDRWIINKVGEANIPADWRGTWEKKHKSLNYKVKVAPVDALFADIQSIKVNAAGNGPKITANGKIDVRAYPAYFGNSGKESEGDLKRCSFTYDLVLIHILCFSQNLLELIQVTFGEFVFATNFGTRQSKGFGSFSTIDFTSVHGHYHFDVPIPKSGVDANFFERELFYRIDLIYRALRSGVNVPKQDEKGNNLPACEQNSKFYFKSILWAYAKGKSIQWEKKTIKEAILSGSACYGKQLAANGSNADTPFGFASVKKRLMKAMLGLSTEELWLTYNNARFTIESEERELNTGKPTYSRVKSPIVFKPIRISEKVYRVFILVERIGKEIYGKQFEVIGTKGGKVAISTPTDETEFDLLEFMDFAFSRKDASGKYVIDLQTFVSNPLMQNTREFRVLDEIFKSIRKEK